MADNGTKRLNETLFSATGALDEIAKNSCVQNIYGDVWHRLILGAFFASPDDAVDDSRSCANIFGRVSFTDHGY